MDLSRNDPTEPLSDELRQAEEELEEALSEACATKPPSEIETGDLIHVDELLEIASEAAKRAVSLRRRRRADKTARRGGAAAMADAEAAVSPGETHRSITDVRGVTWTVFAVYPEARPSPHSQLRGTFQQGWLCYDSGVEKRRLSPIPENWQALSDDELGQLAQRAEVGGRRRSRRSGTEGGPPDDRPPAA